MTDSFLPGEVGVGGWLVSRVLEVDLGEILRASGPFSAISFTIVPPWARGSAHLWRVCGDN